MDCLTPPAEQAHATDHGSGDRVQDELPRVCRIGAVLAEEEGTKQYAAKSGDRRAQYEGPGANGGEANAGAASRFWVAADGVYVAAEAGPLEQKCRSEEHTSELQSPCN